MSKDETVRSLFWLALILAVLGAMVGSPQGSVFMESLALLLALPALFTGSKKWRIAAAAVVIIAAAIAASCFSAASREAATYRQRATGDKR